MKKLKKLGIIKELNLQEDQTSGVILAQVMASKTYSKNNRTSRELDGGKKGIAATTIQEKGIRKTKKELHYVFPRELSAGRILELAVLHLKEGLRSKGLIEKESNISSFTGLYHSEGSLKSFATSGYVEKEGEEYLIKTFYPSEPVPNVPFLSAVFCPEGVQDEYFSTKGVYRCNEPNEIQPLEDYSDCLAGKKRKKRNNIRPMLKDQREKYLRKEESLEQARGEALLDYFRDQVGQNIEVPLAEILSAQNQVADQNQTLTNFKNQLRNGSSPSYSWLEENFPVLMTLAVKDAYDYKNLFSIYLFRMINTLGLGDAIFEKIMNVLEPIRFNEQKLDDKEFSLEFFNNTLAFNAVNKCRNWSIHIDEEWRTLQQEIRFKGHNDLKCFLALALCPGKLMRTFQVRW